MVVGPDKHHLFDISNDSGSNESSRRNMVKKTANFAPSWPLYMLQLIFGFSYFYNLTSQFFF